MKATARMLKRTRREIMRAFLQAYAEPPHCKARSSDMMAGISVTIPGISSCFISWNQLMAPY
jgi:hypothetical protein